MSADRAERARAIFFDVLDRPLKERAAFLGEQCSDDAELRAEVQSLLDNDDSSDDFMATPVVECHEHTTRSVQESPADSGRRIGRYEIRRVIGTGGMGTVYEAVQDHPHRLVALKVLRSGAASPQALKRFRHEAEILGRLRHPNIAQIHDAGTFDDGQGAQPYFAMELVKGKPLIAYAESGKLGTQDRMALFVKVCAAVQYAHHKGVIHRDLKPDNILVDDFQEPKILDFGNARATDSDIQATTLRTDIGQLIGTIPYMSPEQVSGDPTELDTRSDVYSLGVVLYELMCGRLPHDLKNKAIPDAVRVIREEDPMPLSSINRSYRGDVETIVAKALEKEKERRYQSPAELAADVRHYLADEPIVARPASTFYQLRKFARRNKTIVSAAALVFAALSAGVIIATWQAVQARAEAAKATSINEFLLDLLALANPAEQNNEFSPGVAGPRIQTIEELLDEAAASLEAALSEWPEVRADLHLRLGRNYWGLGRTDEVLPHLRRAHELRAATLGDDHPETLLALSSWAGWLDDNGRWEEAEPLHRQVVEGLQDAVGPNDRRTLGAGIWLATNLNAQGKTGEGEDRLIDIIRIARSRFGDSDRLTLVGNLWYGRLLHRLGRYADTEQLVGATFELAQSSLPTSDLLTANIAHTLGRAVMSQGRPAESIDLLVRARDSYQIQGAVETVWGLEATFDLCRALRALERQSEAKDIYESTLQGCRRKLGERHDFTLWALGAYMNHLREQGSLAEALDLIRGASPESRPLDNIFALYVMHINGLVLRDDGRFEEAKHWLERVLAGRRRALGENNIETLDTLRVLAQVHQAQGNFETAATLFRENIDRNVSAYGGESRRALLAMNAYASSLTDADDLKKMADAEDLAREATTLARSALGEDDQLTLSIADTLAVVLHLQGKHEEAVVEFDQIAAAGVPSMSSVHYGRCLLELERFKEAESVLLAAHNQGSAPAGRALKDLYDAWGQPEKAAQYREILPPP